MDVEQWTDIHTLDCETVGFRVAVALGMTGIRNPIPGPEFQHVYGTLKHCTGALKCGFAIPATAGDLVLSTCPVADRIRRILGDEQTVSRERWGSEVHDLPCMNGETDHIRSRKNANVLEISDQKLHGAVGEITVLGKPKTDERKY